MGASVNSAKELNQSFANYSNHVTYSVVTRPESIVPNSLLKEAEAIRLLIEGLKLEEVIIAGHSEGANKAVDLVSLLQRKNPEIKVRGLILFDMVGLHDQDGWKLALDFAGDTLVDTLPDNLLREKRGSLSKRAISTVGAGFDLARGLVNEVKLSGLKYPERLTSQIRDMAGKNPRIGEITSPVVLISGAKDPISSRERIVPEAEEDKATKAFLQSLNSDSPKRDPREVYLNAYLFRKSPYFRMVVPDHFGHHGLPLFRPESVAKASLYLLKRYWRNLK